MQQIAYYPGCSLEGTSIEYDMSVREIMPVLGIELIDIPDWNCCGATAAHSTNHALAMSLPARVLALAQKEGAEKILAPCAMCSNRLIIVNKELLNDKKLLKEVEDTIEMSYNPAEMKILNILQILLEIGLNDIAGIIKTGFKGKKAACYYGCLLVRPPKLMDFDDAENPVSMDKIVEAIGLEPIDWSFKVDCCGGGFSMSRTDIVEKLSNDILEDAQDKGAEMIVVACPMCHSNLDLRQKQIEKLYNTKYDIPIVYITELIGLALGIEPKKLGMNKHFVNTKSVFNS